MPLTDIAARNAKPQAKRYKLADSGGLYLLVTEDGRKYWRLKYRSPYERSTKNPKKFKEKTLALGVYPDVRVSDAREKRDEAKRLIKSGQDPAHMRKQQRRAAIVSAINNFKAISREWWEQQRMRWTPGHAQRVLDSLEHDVFPDLGFRPISEITAPELLAVLRKVEARDAIETAHRILGRCRAVFRYAISTGRCARNPATDLVGALKPITRSNYAALAERDLPEFLRKLDTYDGHRETKIALRLIVLTFVRTDELRAAEWPEFDVERATWRIPAERMKMGVEHLVPLSRQALEELEELKRLTGKARYLFPNQSKPRTYMSENTMLYALYRLGYHSRATVHGFRATASTILNEQGWRADAVERQLAHAERDKVRAAYHRAEYLDERRRMMQAWADHLDALRVGGNVVPITGRAVGR